MNADPSPVVAALTTATNDLNAFLADLFATVEQQTTGWSDDTPSRRAQRTYERRLVAGLERLTEALDGIGTAAERHRRTAPEPVRIPAQRPPTPSSADDRHGPGLRPRNPVILVGGPADRRVRRVATGQ